MRSLLSQSQTPTAPRRTQSASTTALTAQFPSFPESPCDGARFRASPASRASLGARLERSSRQVRAGPSTFALGRSHAQTPSVSPAESSPARGRSPFDALRARTSLSRDPKSEVSLRAHLERRSTPTRSARTPLVVSPSPASIGGLFEGVARPRRARRCAVSPAGETPYYGLTSLARSGEGDETRDPLRPRLRETAPERAACSESPRRDPKYAAPEVPSFDEPVAPRVARRLVSCRTAFGARSKPKLRPTSPPGLSTGCSQPGDKHYAPCSTSWGEPILTKRRPRGRAAHATKSLRWVCGPSVSTFVVV